MSSSSSSSSSLSRHTTSMGCLSNGVSAGGFDSVLTLVSSLDSVAGFSSSESS